MRLLADAHTPVARSTPTARYRGAAACHRGSTELLSVLGGACARSRATAW
ncbi:hypothetical protein [Prauserella sp. PE36]|nr:hypothetical protein [Prauserella sp. PE36]